MFTRVTIMIGLVVLVSGMTAVVKTRKNVEVAGEAPSQNELLALRDHARQLSGRIERLYAAERGEEAMALERQLAELHHHLVRAEHEAEIREIETRAGKLEREIETLQSSGRHEEAQHVGNELRELEVDREHRTLELRAALMAAEQARVESTVRIEQAQRAAEIHEITSRSEEVRRELEELTERGHLEEAAALRQELEDLERVQSLQEYQWQVGALQAQDQQAESELNIQHVRNEAELRELAVRGDMLRREIERMTLHGDLSAVKDLGRELHTLERQREIQEQISELRAEEARLRFQEARQQFEEVQAEAERRELQDRALELGRALELDPHNRRREYEEALRRGLLEWRGGHEAPPPAEGGPLHSHEDSPSEHDRNRRVAELEQRAHQLHRSAEEHLALGRADEAEELLREAHELRRIAHEMAPPNHPPVHRQGAGDHVRELTRVVHELRGDVRDLRDEIRALRELVRQFSAK